MTSLIGRVNAFIAQEEGATMIEYGLLIAMIAIACLAAMDYMGIRISAIFYRITFILTTGRDPRF